MVFLSLAVEAGRLKNIQEENRLCELFAVGEVESESHFLLYLVSTQVYFVSKESKMDF